MENVMKSWVENDYCTIILPLGAIQTHTKYALSNSNLHSSFIQLWFINVIFY